MSVPPPPPPRQPLTTQQFVDMGKIPDFVRDVKPFNGSPTELVDWLSDVDNIFSVYKENNATEIQLSILERTIRRKVSGEAADVLNANNIQCDWEEIKNTLVLYYRDKRDIKTLDYELTSIKKSANESLSTYYSRVNELLSYIISQVQTNEKMRPNASAHIDYFRDKSLDAFIRGLERPLSILLKSSNPKTLSQAYQFCIEYYNMDLRVAPYRNELGNQPLPKPKEAPRVPPRIYPSNVRPNLPPPPPPRYHNPFPYRPQQNPFRTNPSQPYPPRPINPPQRAFPPPEPMEVDSSLRTKNVNYGNRPPINFKRPYVPSQQQQQFKRQAHPLENGNQNYYDNYYQEDEQYYDEQYQYYDDTDQYEPCHPPGYDTEQSVTDEKEPEPSTSGGANFLEWHPKW